MEEEIQYRKVLFLLLSGWVNLTKIQDTLGLDKEQMAQAVKKLKEEGYIVTHTIH